jgi:hypothetical protein
VKFVRNHTVTWRTGMAIAALFCLFALVLILVVYRPPPGALARAAGGSTWWNPPDWPKLRITAAACLAVSAMVIPIEP